jgi:aminopeptidase N
MRKTTFFIAVLFVTSTFAQTPVIRENDDNLTRKMAEFRKSQIDKVDYTLQFELKEVAEKFQGHEQIDVTLKKTDQPLSIDFTGDIQTLKVNGQTVAQFTKRKGSFDIPSKYLKPMTKIEIDYQATFSKMGAGLQRVVDPEDKSVYIYSDSEPFYAHTFYPSFDQPDLKARFDLTVKIPENWKAISNELIASSHSDHDQLKVQFKKTLQISPYLFFVGVGPFEEWKDTSGSIPLYIYARKTMAPFVDADRLFETLHKGLKFYSEYFGTPYPFSKYGEVFIPEFEWGGMENPGAVSLNERSLFRGSESAARFEARDNLILHEMAHMWFGDLVTMKWWDDLWLNESFATHMAHIASKQAMQARTSDMMSIQNKSGGYWQDQLSTTHPIESTLPDTRSTKGNFDGITYAKGAASLKQLNYFVGEEGFKKGLQAYFKKYAFQNTNLQDFISEITKASGVDLNAWTKSWIQSAGPHRVQARWSCDKGQIADFSIEQTENASHILAPHKTKIEFFKEKNGKLELYFAEAVSYSGKTTSIKTLKGKKCPDFVFPNSGDYDYALFSLDPVSIQKAPMILKGGLDDPHLRLMTWNILTQMVRDQKYAASYYFETALDTIKAENDENLLATYLNSVANHYSVWLTIEERQRLTPEFEKIALEKLDSAPAKSDMQMNYFDFYINMARSPEAQKRLEAYLQNENLPSGFKLDQDRRWNIVRKLAQTMSENVVTIIANEEKRDPTTEGHRDAFAARVAIPTIDAKREFWKVVDDRPQSVPETTLMAGAYAFNDWSHPELSQAYVDSYFKKAIKTDWKNNDDFAKVYFWALFPHNICSEKLLKTSLEQMKKSHGLTNLAKRYWTEANDNLGICVGVRKLSSTAPVLR